PDAGTVLELKVKVGDRVSTGDPVVVLQTDSAAGAAPPAAAPAPEGQEAAAPATPVEQPSPRPAPRAEAPAPAPIDEAGFSRAHASPSVRKLARELGVDLGRVRGSGRKGRVTSDDVKKFVKQALRD